MHRVLVALSLVASVAHAQTETNREKSLYSFAVLFGSAKAAAEACPDLEVDTGAVDAFAARLAIASAEMPHLKEVLASIGPIIVAELQRDGKVRFCYGITSKLGPDSNAPFKLLRYKH